MYKRKAVESAQTAADLKLHLDKYHAQMNEAQSSLAEKSRTVQSQAFKYKRTQEEVARMRRKLERAKRIEMASSADEVLLEEIREYKVKYLISTPALCLCCYILHIVCVF